MRTTLTLERDVAALLRRVMTRDRRSLKQTVNDALRAGLDQLDRSGTQAAADPTRPADLGACLIGSIDDVSEALALSEGDGFR
jgi:hypothetical protein